MNKLIIGFVALAFLVSCGGSELELKKKELETLKTQLSEITSQIESLEKEIALLDTASGGGLKTKMVKVDTLTPTEFVHFIEVQGSVDSDENILVSPEMNGVVTGINVNEGDMVKAGTVMATLESAALVSGLEEARTGLALAKTTFEKQKRLWEQKIGSEIQYLQAKTNMESLESRVKSLEAQVNMSRIKSPINGAVDEVKVKIGEMASPGMSGIRVVNLDKMKIKSNVADAYVTRVRKGSPVVVELPDLGLSVPTKISFVSQVINPGNRSLNVEINMDNKDKMLKPNMVAKIKIEDERLADVMVVPSNIIQKSGTGFYVLVAVKENGKYYARRRDVQTGSAYNGQTVIVEGIKAGDLVIVFGFQDIVDGQPLMF